MHHHDLTSVPLPEQLSPNAELLDDLAELYKIFGDSTRIKILYTLFTEERGVGDIARLLGMTMSAISHQLRILKQARLVKPRREGKMVYYALADDHVRTIFAQGLDHILEYVTPLASSRGTGDWLPQPASYWHLIYGCKSVLSPNSHGLKRPEGSECPHRGSASV